MTDSPPQARPRLGAPRAGILDALESSAEAVKRSERLLGETERLVRPTGATREERSGGR